MKVLRTIAAVRAAHGVARDAGQTIGLVPTMGFLHTGHASLMHAARRDTDLVTATIFVNPLQFAPTEDLASYPRDLERDTELAAAAGVDVLFVPDATEMFPDGEMQTTVRVDALARRWEGASRLGHFAGVATIVAKLFAIAGPCRAYFGEKDFQQLQVVRRMAFDLSLPVDVVGCPIVRETDGLALSSRNVYLTKEQRAAAPVLKAALDAASAAIRAGERSGSAVEALVAKHIATEPLAKLDYIGAVDAATLEPLRLLQGEIRLLLTARVGIPRLLDNCGLSLA